MEKSELDKLTPSEIESKMIYAENVTKLIEYHQIACGIKVNDTSKTTVGQAYIYRILTEDYGRSIPIEMSKLEEEFINTAYVSTYMKKEILSNIFTDEAKKEALTLLKGHKPFKFMTKEEIKLIDNEVKKLERLKSDISYNGSNKFFYSKFFNYIFKLNSKNVKEFLIKKLGTKELCAKILERSGLSSSGGYYAGRGVKIDDLNEDHLISIYKKLLPFDPKYADEFVKMVVNMDTIGATEFICNFYRFGQNGFKCEGLIPTQDNVYGDNPNSMEMFHGYINHACRKDGDSQKDLWLSRRIKNGLCDYVESPHTSDSGYSRRKRLHGLY